MLPKRGWEEDFLEAFVEHYGSVTHAARQAGVALEVVEDCVRLNPLFRDEIELKRETLRDTVRKELMRRALEPERIPQYSRGRVVGYTEKWDNRLLTWLAERMMPEEFHLETKLDHTGGSGEVSFKLELGPAKVQENANPEE